MKGPFAQKPFLLQVTEQGLPEKNPGKTAGFDLIDKNNF